MCYIFLSFQQCFLSRNKLLGLFVCILGDLNEMSFFFFGGVGFYFWARCVALFFDGYVLGDGFGWRDWIRKEYTISAVPC